MKSYLRQHSYAKPKIAILFFALVFLMIFSFSTHCYSAEIEEAEYFFDVDPGNGNGIAISAVDGSFDSEEEAIDFSGIDLSSLKIGFHTVYVRFKSTDGVWGVARPISYDPNFISPYNFRITGEKWITDAEYFIDIDPGQGNGSPVTTLDGVFDDPAEELELSNIDISSFDPGFHKLFLRLKDSEGTWGAVREVVFEVYEKSIIAGAEYFIDEDPGPGSGIPLPAKDGLFDSGEEEIDLANIDISGRSEGAHTLHVRYKDQLNRWGAEQKTYFSVNRPIAYVLPDMFQPIGRGKSPS